MANAAKKDKKKHSQEAQEIEKEKITDFNGKEINFHRPNYDKIVNPFFIRPKFAESGDPKASKQRRIRLKVKKESLKKSLEEIEKQLPEKIEG